MASCFCKGLGLALEAKICPNQPQALTSIKYSQQVFFCPFFFSRRSRLQVLLRHACKKKNHANIRRSDLRMFILSTGRILRSITQKLNLKTKTRLLQGNDVNCTEIRMSTPPSRDRHTCSIRPSRGLASGGGGAVSFFSPNVFGPNFPKNLNCPKII